MTSEQDVVGNLAALSEAQLLPCPWCESTCLHLQHTDTRWFVECHELLCLADGPTRPTKKEAITAWNTRAEAAEAQVARLKALVKELADDLEAEVQDRWGYDERLAHKLKRDMDVVVRARGELEEPSQ